MERLFTVKELADYLNVKVSTIYRWVHEGYLRPVKLGRFLRFRESAIEAWVLKRERHIRVKSKVDF